MAEILMANVHLLLCGHCRRAYRYAEVTEHESTKLRRMLGNRPENARSEFGGFSPLRRGTRNLPIF